MSSLKYVTLSPAHHAWWDDLQHFNSLSSGIDRVQVFETSDEPRPTGLLDLHGNELFRVTKRRPIGFRTLKE